MTESTGGTVVAGADLVGSLVEKLRLGDPSVRLNAVKALARLGPEAASAVPTLGDALRDGSLLIRVAAAETLSNLGPLAVPAVPNLVESLADRYTSVREMAAEALGRIGASSRPAIGPLFQLMADEDKYVQSQSSSALVRIAEAIGGEAVETYAAYLAHGNAQARSTAARALAAIGPVALPVLDRIEQLTKDDDRNVREAAEDAIDRLTGRVREPGPSPFEGIEAASGGEVPAAAVPEESVLAEEVDSPGVPALAPAPSVKLATWSVPPTVELGRLEPATSYTRTIRVVVPVHCHVVCHQGGVAIEPSYLTRGRHELSLRIDTPPAPGPVRTRVSLVGASQRRSLLVEYEAADTPAGLDSPETRAMVWEAPDWDRPASAATAGESYTRTTPDPDAPAPWWAAAEASEPPTLISSDAPADAIVIPKADVIVEPAGPITAETEPVSAALRKPKSPKPPARRLRSWSVAMLTALVLVPAMLAAISFSPRFLRTIRDNGPDSAGTGTGTETVVDVKPPVTKTPAPVTNTPTPAPITPTPAPIAPAPVANTPPTNPDPPKVALNTPNPRVTATPGVSKKAADIVPPTPPAQPTQGGTPTAVNPPPQPPTSTGNEEALPDFRTRKGGIELRIIKPGKFVMGDDKSNPDSDFPDGPAHPVTITRPFLMSQYEITRGQWREVMGTDPGQDGSGTPTKANEARIDRERLPVVDKSWFDAVAFCNALSAAEGIPQYYRITGTAPKLSVAFIRPDGDGYRLPTEAEWEYACRAGTTTKWSFGDKTDELGRHAWFGTGDDSDRARPVGQLLPNRFGLYDMHGNVVEWCWDWYGPYTKAAATDPMGPAGPGESESRVFRGGSWKTLEPETASARRSAARPQLFDPDTGFRIVRKYAGKSK